MDELKGVVAEWILTNGKLPGFDDRLKATLPHWSVVERDLIVYRGQGGVITPNVSTVHPTEILSDVRSVIATSSSPDSVIRYAGQDCCVYKITLKPGIRYIDVNKLISFIAPEGLGRRVISVKNTVLQDVLDRCPPTNKFPNPATTPQQARHALMERCFGRYRMTDDGIQLVVPPELEIMVDGTQGAFQNKKPVCPMIQETITYTIDYAPKSAGRGRTLRRTSRRRDKNGRRPARKSKNRHRRG
jgi:hypothetical protein